MNEMKTITLQDPIKRDDKTIHEVSIREPKAGDLRGLKLLDVLQSDVDSYAVLLPRITTPSLISADIYRLKLMDVAAFAEGVAGFLEKPKKDDEEMTD